MTFRDLQLNFPFFTYSVVEKNLAKCRKHSIIGKLFYICDKYLSSSDTAVRCEDNADFIS